MTGRAADPDGGPPQSVVRQSEDRLLGGRVRLRQPAAGYRAAIDPIFLAAAVPATPGQSVLDLGCGVGAAALCLLTRVSGTRAVGLELQDGLACLARTNAADNRLTDRLLVLTGDVLRPPPRLAPGAFDHVMCNPPHLPAAQARPSAHGERDMANREGTADLADWVTAALTMTRAKGSVTFVHRADRMDDLLSALRGGAGEVVVCPLWPGQGKPAKRILVRARKAVATPLRLAAGMLLHHPDGRFTAEAQAVLRDGAALQP